MIRVLGHRALAIIAGSSTLYLIQKNKSISEFLDEKDLYVVVLSVYMLLYEIIYQLIKRKLYDTK
jgi:hypothetical protein